MLGKRPLAPALAAALTAAALVVPGWLLASTAGAPVEQTLTPPARTQPTAALTPWDGSAAPEGMTGDVWCTGDGGASTAAGGCRAFNADDYTITAWAREALIAPYVAAQAAT